MVRDREPDGKYGWGVAIVGAVALVFTFGTPFSYGIFLDPLSEHYGYSAFWLSLVFSIHLFASYSVAGVFGVLATSYHSKHHLLGLGILTGVLAPSLYVVDSFAGLLVVFSVLGAVIGSVVVVIVSVVPRWFDAYRGLATGVLFVGIGLSLFVLPPAWHMAFTTLGVEAGFLAIIGLSAVSFILAGLVCHRPPWVSQESMPLGSLAHWMRGVLHSRRFYYLVMGFGLAFAWFYLLAGYSVPYFESRGLDRATASFAFGLIGGISIASRLGSGALADHLGYGRTYLLSLGFAAVGCVLLLVPSMLSMSLAIVCFGISLGGVTTLYVPIALRVYDPDKSTAIIGLFSIGLGMTAIAAPPTAALIIAHTNSFFVVIGFTLLTVLAASLFVWLGTRTH